jgi:chaperonin GroEL
MTNGASAPLLVILERPSSEMSEFLITMKKSGFNVCSIGLTAYTEYENQTLLSDIAVFSAGEVFEPSVDNTKLVLGVADKIVVTESKATISVAEKTDRLKELLTSLESAEKKDENRIKRLNGLASLVEVGGFNMTDIVERFDRAEDCIASIKTVSEEGWIAGGGSTLIYISSIMNTKLDNKSEQRGYDLVKAVLQEPFKRILHNSNKKELFDNFEPTYGYGYNALTDTLTDLIQDDVLDSKKSITLKLSISSKLSIPVTSKVKLSAFFGSNKIKSKSKKFPLVFLTKIFK